MKQHRKSKFSKHHTSLSDCSKQREIFGIDQDEHGDFNSGFISAKYEDEKSTTLTLGPFHQHGQNGQIVEWNTKSLGFGPI